MMEVRPPPPYTRHAHIKFSTVDQTYAVAGGGIGAASAYHNGIERVDKKGEKVRVARETYINGFDIGVPDWACRLSEAAEKAIALRGPYTQDFIRILPHLHPQKSEVPATLAPVMPALHARHICHPLCLPS